MIKTIAIIALALTGFSLAHESVTIGPNGGRVLYADSTTTPNVEVLVNPEGRAEIWLLDKDRKPIPPGTQTITVTAGPRTEAKKLPAEVQGAKYITDKVPGGAPYTMVVQVRESPGAKPLTLRLNYDPAPTASGKPNYLDDSVNAQSGENIAVPAAIEGLWAQINQHQGELVEGVADKKYEALDEVTRAYPTLLLALPAKSGDKQAAATPLVESLVKHLAAVRTANAARKLDDAKPALSGIEDTLAQLKKLYPSEIANAKLSE
jgi:hypothetical protein